MRRSQKRGAPPPLAGKKSLSLSLANIYETIAISWPTVVDALRGRVTKRICDERLAQWAERLVTNARIEVAVRGRERLDGRTFLIMSNHQSLYDVPVLFHVIGPNLRMVAKKELFGVPIFGPAMREGGFISIDRENRASAIASLQEAKRLFDSGTHVWISPEGTRSRTGQLLTFKKGGFVLAMESGTSILPVSLRGTRDVLAAKGMRSIAGAHVDVTLHAPIDPRAYGSADDRQAREQLMSDVRAAIESAI
jgi:1-acyl-sn-glycerol-3-phosphate acyltransferase